jgi:hypothetical protein
MKFADVIKSKGLDHVFNANSVTALGDCSPDWLGVLGILCPKEPRRIGESG